MSRAKPTAAARRLAARHDGFSPERQRKFLEYLAETASVARAALLTGVSRNTVYRLRTDPDAHHFRTAWEEALARAMDTLTDIAFNRAVDGVQEPVFYQGEQVAIRVRYSDPLLMFLLSRRQMFQPLKLAEDRRTVYPLHDEASYAAALDRIAPAPPPEPAPAALPPARTAETDEDAGTQKDATPATILVPIPRPPEAPSRDLSLSSLSDGSTPSRDDGMDGAHEGDDLA